MIGEFHFLRPEWLLGLAAAALLWWIVRRQEDFRTRWQGAIAPHLLDHLLVNRQGFRRLRPVHHAVLMLVLASVAAAGPTWEKDRPPFVEDKAPLVIAIDLSQTMDAIDIAPTRLERAKLKVRDLLALRPGGRTAIYAYAGSAHRVLPLTDDANLIQTYVDSLATGLMPVPGKDTAGALKAVEEGLAREETPGTILFITDGVDEKSFDAFSNHQGKNELMVLGIGTAEGGPVKTGHASFATAAAGGRLFSKLDVEGLKKLKGSDVLVATITPDDGDVNWIQRHVQSHLQQKEVDEKSRWRDEGWVLLIPIVLLAALWFRRGWTIRWAGMLMVALGASMAMPDGAEAGDWRFADLWLSKDQQGQLAFQHGDYAAAAERFEDPMRRGVAYYRAGKYEEAVESFARTDTAESWFNQGNALARLGRFPAAVASYHEALKRRPKWSEAQANLELVAGLIPKDKDKDEQGDEDPDVPPDQVKFDEKGKKGKQGEVRMGKQTAEMWMRNIQTSPAQLLQRKFALQARESRK